MEKNTIISFNFFEQSLAERVVNFQEAEESLKTKENKEALKQEIKQTYKKLYSDLKQSISEGLAVLKEEHLKKLNQLETDLKNGLEEADKKFAENKDSKEYKNVKFGLEIACKRAKIKEKNNYNDAIKELKLKRVFLHEEYTKLIYNLTGVISPLESLRNKAIETKAEFNFNDFLK